MAARETLGHETDVRVESAWHPSGDEYAVAIATCDQCDWTQRGDESDTRDAAAQHERETAPRGSIGTLVPELVRDALLLAIIEDDDYEWPDGVGHDLHDRGLAAVQSWPSGEYTSYATSKGRDLIKRALASFGSDGSDA